MRRGLVGLLVLGAAAVLLVERAGPPDTCATTMDFGGINYAVYEATEEITAREDLGIGVERGCGQGGLWSEDVGVSRIAGVEPRVALVTPAAAHVLYVAEDVTVDELPTGIAALVAP